MSTHPAMHFSRILSAICSSNLNNSFSNPKSCRFSGEGGHYGGGLSWNTNLEFNSIFQPLWWPQIFGYSGRNKAINMGSKIKFNYGNIPEVFKPGVQEIENG